MHSFGMLYIYSNHMKDLFNNTFFKFTLGFVGILIASFAFIAVVSHIDSAQSASTGNSIEPL